MPIRMLTKSKTILDHSLSWGSESLVLVVSLVFLLALVSPSYSNAQEADGTNCASGVVGLCTPGTFESSTSTSDVTYTNAFESTAVGISFAVNDDFSVGYGVFEADYESTSLVDQESTAITASYTMGSMTIGGLIGDDQNIAGVAANDNDKYEVSLSIAF